MRTVIADDTLLQDQAFNFSGLKGQTKVGREGLHYFSKRVTLVVAALNADFLHLFVEKLFGHPRLEVGQLLLEPEYAETEIQPEFSTFQKYLCLSPMVLTDKHSHGQAKEFIYPTMDEFSDLIYESTMQRMERWGHYTPEQTANFFRFQLIPDKAYLENFFFNDR